MKYLVETSFRGIPTPEALALIPAEMAHGQMLEAKGKRQWVLIAADQSRAWQLFDALSVEETKTLLASFPLYPYLNATITPIADPSTSPERSS